MKYFAVLLMLAVFVPALRAQSSSDSSWKDIRLGGMFMPGLSADAGNVANGAKTKAVNFSWSLGALADFPFTPTLGVQAALAYDARSVEFHDQKTADTSIAYTFSYFAIRPELRIGDFLVGVGLDVPIGASTTASASATRLNSTRSLGASSLNTLIEGRIGASVPVFQSDNGNQLKFLIDASYAFGNIVSDSFAPLKPNDNNVSNKSDNNGPLATLQLGFSYLFDLNPR